MACNSVLASKLNAAGNQAAGRQQAGQDSCVCVCVYFILAKYGDRMLRLSRLSMWPRQRAGSRVQGATQIHYPNSDATWTLTEVAQSAQTEDFGHDRRDVAAARFGQFLHLRKRSLDRLRACGDLTVFKPNSNNDSSSRQRDGFFVVTPTPTGQRVRPTTTTRSTVKSPYIWPTLESNPSACFSWLSWFWANKSQCCRCRCCCSWRAHALHPKPVALVNSLGSP